MTTNKKKRPYFKTGLYSDASPVKTETHPHLANGKYWRTAEQAQKLKDLKNLRQRNGYAAPDPEGHRRMMEALGDPTSMRQLIRDWHKLRRIRHLVEDGASMSDFIMKVIEILEEEE
jgi:hypothetical protein